MTPHIIVIVIIVHTFRAGVPHGSLVPHYLIIIIIVPDGNMLHRRKYILTVHSFVISKILSPCGGSFFKSNAHVTYLITALLFC